MLIAFDIETADNGSAYNETYLETLKHKGLKDPDKVAKDLAEKREKFALSPITGKVICVGFMSQAGTKIFKTDTCSEGDLLLKVWEEFEDLLANNNKIISFNGLLFDIPFLIQRSLLLGIPVDKNMADLLLRKYSNPFHIDLRTYLPEGSLRVLSHIAFNNALEDPNGGDIKEFYLKGDWEAIEKKNIADLAGTLALGKLLFQGIPVIPDIDFPLKKEDGK
jgi:hypothetical protein